MKYTLKKTEEWDKAFLLDLRKITMLSYLEKANIILAEEDHIARVNSFFDSSYVIKGLEGENIWLLKYVESIKSLELVQLQVLPKYQNKGIGTNILKDLITQSKKLNKQLTLKVLKNNPAISLYKRVWFTITWEDEIEYHMGMG